MDFSLAASRGVESQSACSWVVKRARNARVISESMSRKARSRPGTRAAGGRAAGWPRRPGGRRGRGGRGRPSAGRWSGRCRAPRAAACGRRCGRRRPGRRRRTGWLRTTNRASSASVHAGMSFSAGDGHATGTQVLCRSVAGWTGHDHGYDRPPPRGVNSGCSWAERRTGRVRYPPDCAAARVSRDAVGPGQNRAIWRLTASPAHLADARSCGRTVNRGRPQAIGAPTSSGRRRLLRVDAAGQPARGVLVWFPRRAGSRIRVRASLPDRDRE